MIPKIDAHHHLWKYNPQQHGWIDDSMQLIQRDFYPEDLAPALEENGVVGTVLVQVDMTEEDNVFSLAQAALSRHSDARRSPGGPQVGEANDSFPSRHSDARRSPGLEVHEAHDSFNSRHSDDRRSPGLQVGEANDSFNSRHSDARRSPGLQVNEAHDSFHSRHSDDRRSPGPQVNEANDSFNSRHSNARRSPGYPPQADKSSFIKGIVGWIDLLAPDLPAQLEKWLEQPLMKGFRHIAQAEPNDFLARPEIIRGIEQLGKAGFTYDILIKPTQLDAAVKLVRALPDQPFVVDHVAKPYIKTGEIETWAAGMRALAENKNVYCKISGMVTEADWRHWTYEQLRPYMEMALEAFGPDRLMFGSDWPVCLVAASYTQWVQTVERFVSTLSVPEQEAIWQKNAIRFYNL